MGDTILANKAWKKFEQSDGFRKIKLKLKQLFGKEPKLQKDIELSTEQFKDWVVVPELIHENDIVYAIGICDNIDFEMYIIKQKKVQVYAFDPTPFSVNWINEQNLPPMFHFYPWAAAGSDGKFFFYPRISKHGKKSDGMYTFHKHEEQRDDGISVDAFTIESMINELGHKKIDILKLDVESAEYEVLESLLETSLRPKQILVEFHHRFKGIGKDKTVKAVKHLHQEGYLIAHISVTGREVTFVHNSALS